jgi:hypothetical protein
MRRAVFVILAVAFITSATYLAAILRAGPKPSQAPAISSVLTVPRFKTADEELAYLLVKLELKTRATIAENFTSEQSSLPGINVAYQHWLTKNRMLPAAVAGVVYSDTVPNATNGRAWVKMVVREPRNPKNKGDEVALDMLTEIQQGVKSSQRTADAAVYYGEPIVAKQWCLRCHGDKRGEPDPSFPQFRKDGWKEGDIIGAVIARVEPRRFQ